MNIHQLKQNWQNNWWYGENRHLADGDRPLSTDTLIQPNYTRTWLIDISPWDGFVNLTVTKSLGCSGVIIKGVDGTINSRYFPENYAKAVEVGLARSSYAWLYRDVNVRCTAQAQAFDTLLNKYPPSPAIRPAVDFESTKYGGVQSDPNFTDLRKWVTEWLRLGNPKPLLYSGRYYMDQFGQMPSDLMDMFEGLWIANYSSFNPPLPLGWTKWILHQWTAQGDALLLAPGTTNKQELDLSYSYSVITPAPAIVDGYQEFRRYDSDCYVWRGRPARVHVTDTHGQLETVSSAARRLGADIAVNGDGWYSINGNLPLSLAASNGTLYQSEQYDLRPFLNASQSNAFAVSHQLSSVTPYNLVSGTRYQVKSGVNAFASSTDPEHITERHPRTAAGHTADGRLILCVVDGRSAESAGVTLRELADLLILCGASWAIELDGGGSSALDKELLGEPIQPKMYVKDKQGVIQNVPSDGAERAVVNHLLVFTEGANMQYKVIWPNGVAKRRGPTTSSLSTGVVLAVNTVVEVLADEIPDATYPNDLNKRWVKFTDDTYGASKYDTVRMELVSAPPPAPAHVVEVVVDGVVEFRKELT